VWITKGLQGEKKGANSKRNYPAGMLRLVKDAPRGDPVEVSEDDEDPGGEEEAKHDIPGSSSGEDTSAHISDADDNDAGQDQEHVYTDEVYVPPRTPPKKSRSNRPKPAVPQEHELPPSAFKKYTYIGPVSSSSYWFGKEYAARTFGAHYKHYFLTGVVTGTTTNNGHLRYTVGDFPGDAAGEKFEMTQQCCYEGYIAWLTCGRPKVNSVTYTSPGEPPRTVHQFVEGNYLTFDTDPLEADLDGEEYDPPTDVADDAEDADDESDDTDPDANAENPALAYTARRVAQIVGIVNELLGGGDPWYAFDWHEPSNRRSSRNRCHLDCYVVSQLAVLSCFPYSLCVVPTRGTRLAELFDVMVSLAPPPGQRGQ
jgi:hypothetical protein